MIIFVERKEKPKDNLAALKLISHRLVVISGLIGQISRKLLARDIAEAMDLKEGTYQDRRYVMDRINKLQTELNKLDKITAKFDLGDLDTPTYILQAELKKVGASIKVIHDNLVDVWSERNVGATLELNQVIHEKMDKIFNNINSVIERIETFVKTYNAISKIKLKFSVKWERRPD